MRVYVLLLTCLFFSLLGKPQQPRMMYEDTSRRGVPFSKDPHVVNFQGRYLMYYTLPPTLASHPVKILLIGRKSVK